MAAGMADNAGYQCHEGQFDVHSTDTLDAALVRGQQYQAQELCHSDYDFPARFTREGAKVWCYVFHGHVSVDLVLVVAYTDRVEGAAAACPTSSPPFTRDG